MYESSLGDDTALFSGDRTGSDEDEDARRREVAAEGCRSILDKMVDPAVEMCVVASETKQRLVPNWDREVFIVNVMTYLQVIFLSDSSFDDELTSLPMQSVLEPFAFTAEKQGVIQSLLEGRIMQLIEDHVRVTFLFSATTAFRRLKLLCSIIM